MEWVQFNFLQSEQGTRKGHPYHERKEACLSIVGVPLAGTLASGEMPFTPQRLE